MHDKFVKLTHRWLRDGKVHISPLFVEPDLLHPIVDFEAIIGDRKYDVTETAEEIHKLVLEKLEENRQAQTLGKVD